MCIRLSWCLLVVQTACAGRQRQSLREWCSSVKSLFIDVIIVSGYLEKYSGDILDFHGRPLEPRMSDLCLLSRLSRKKKNAPFCLAKLLVASILWDDVELNAKSNESGLEPALISFSLVSPVRTWTFRMIIVFKLFPSKHPLQKLIKAHWNNWFSWIKVKIIDIERLHRNSLAFTYNTSFDQFCDRVYHTHRISLRILIGYIAQRCCCEWFKDACLLRTKRYWT